MALVAEHKFSLPLSLLSRGFVPAYRVHQVNHCPGCGRSHWLVGRMTAECAFCATAMPINEPEMIGGGVIRHAHTKKLGRLVSALSK